MRTTLAALVLITASLTSGCQSPTAAANDTAAMETTTQVVYLRHAKASDMAAAINQLAGDFPASEHGHLKAVAHDSSSSVLLSGSDLRVGQAVKLVTRLDVESK